MGPTRSGLAGPDPFHFYLEVLVYSAYPGSQSSFVFGYRVIPVFNHCRRTVVNLSLAYCCFSTWFIAVFYLPVIFTIMYCTCIPVMLINAVEDAGMSLGENVTGMPVTSLHP